MTCQRLTFTALALSFLVACSEERSDGAFDTDAVTPEVTATGSTTNDVDEPASSSSSTDPTGSPGSGVDPDADVGCDAVDFLFVIDNSGSMADEQQQLIDSVPGFVAAIEERLPTGTGTYHIMVTDSDPWVYGGCEDGCTESAACEMATVSRWTHPKTIHTPEEPGPTARSTMAKPGSRPTPTTRIPMEMDSATVTARTRISMAM